MTAELYINDQLVDIDQKTVVALSFAVNTLNELKTLNGNISNRITLPLTALNLRTLGFVGDTNILLTNTARKRLLCRYVQNGVEVMPEGVVSVGTITQKGIGIVVTSGNVDFFELIDGSIQDLDLTEYDHIYDTGTVADSRLNREGYIYPIVNYGDMTDASAVVDTRNSRPAMFVKTVVDKIVKEAGFTLINELELNLRTAAQYSKMILPFALDEFAHGQRFIDRNKEFTVIAKQEATVTYNVAHASIDYAVPGGTVNVALITYDTIVVDESSAMNSVGVYQAPGKFIADIQLTIPHIEFPDTIGSPVRTLQLIKRTEFDLVTVLAEVVLTKEGVRTEPSMIHENVVLKASGIKIKYLGINERYYAIFRQGDTVDMIVNKPLTLTITPVISPVSMGDNVEMEATLPDVSKKDFLKAVANLFGGIVQTDNQNKTVQIVPFFNIVNNTLNAVDWSDKLVNPDQETNEVQIGDYAQKNVASYKNDSSILPESYGSSFFNITDENLPLNKPLFELPFSSSFDVSVLAGISAVLIRKIETVGGTDMSVSTEPRIVMVGFISSSVTYTEVGSMFSVTVDDSVPKTFFEGTASEPGLTMKEVLESYYPEIIVMLNDQRKKALSIFLREPDIAALDFFKPVYLRQYGAYFYISKITDYVGERPCKVELIKLY